MNGKKLKKASLTYLLTRLLVNPLTGNPANALQTPFLKKEHTNFSLQ